MCWYSIIHTPAEHLDEAFAELARVLMSGGYLLLAFQAGDGESEHRADAHGTGLPLTSYRHAPDDIAERLRASGLDVRARAQREADLEHESTPQAFLIAQRR